MRSACILAAKRKVEASDPHTTNMGTCILYGKKKVEAAKIASTKEVRANAGRKKGKKIVRVV
jgi:hypothetical protein